MLVFSFGGAITMIKTEEVIMIKTEEVIMFVNVNHAKVAMLI